MAGTQLTKSGRMAGRVPVQSRRVGTAGGITPGQVAEARRDLGRQLAGWRAASGFTQVKLAKRICYSRSAIANVEIGRDHSTRRFWQSADTAVGAGGSLVAAFDQVASLLRDFHTQRARALERENRQRTASSTPPLAEPLGVGPGECECALAVVGRWTGREVHAVREALRMSLRVFAEHLGVTTATVAAWEHRSAPVRLAAQSVLDQALSLADTDTKTRFRLILNSPENCDHPNSTLN